MHRQTWTERDLENGNEEGLFSSGVDKDILFKDHSLSIDDPIDLNSSVVTDVSSSMSVSEFVAVTDNALKNMGTAYVHGEISSVSKYRHLYFTIKDETSSVDCLMWSSKALALDFIPEEGQQVEIVGNSSLYKKNGQFKLIVSSMKLAGRGMILEKLRQLKEKLQQEGIFSRSKRVIPQFIDTVGVITSLEGRVVHDIQMTMKRRNDGVAIRVYNAKVQGEGAAESLIEALSLANQENCCDVLIIGRGGGSFEDLLPFSDEKLTRAVADSKIPIISAVGHEPDVALTDFAADLRAATPTAAAEIVTSVTKEQLYGQINDIMLRLDNEIERNLDNVYMNYESLSSRLKSSSPDTLLKLNQSQLTRQLSRLDSAIDRCLSDKQSSLSALRDRLNLISPESLIARSYNQVAEVVSKLNAGIDKNFNEIKSKFNDSLRKLVSSSVESDFNYLVQNFIKINAKLHTLNPLNVLSRGYSVTFDEHERPLSIDNVKNGDVIYTLISGGKIKSKVEQVDKSKD